MHFLAAQTDKVKSVTLGKQVQRIGYEIKKGYPADYTKAFAAEFIGNGYLEQVTVSSENPYLYADGSGLYSKDKIYALCRCNRQGGLYRKHRLRHRRLGAVL